MSVNIFKNGMLSKIAGAVGDAVPLINNFLTNQEGKGAADANTVYVLNNKIEELNSSLTNENSETFNFGVKDGVRGFFTNPSRADDSFVPFKNTPDFGDGLINISKSFTTTGVEQEIFSIKPKNNAITLTFDATVSYSYYYRIGNGSNIVLSRGNRITLPKTSDTIKFYCNSNGNLYNVTAYLNNIVYS